MSVANTPDVLILTDTGKKTIVKVTAYYDGGANNSNTVIVRSNTLFGANASNTAKATVISITQLQYCAALANGFARLYWVSSGGGANNATAIVVGTQTSGELNAWMKNPLAANAANLVANSGDLALQVQGASNQDSL